MWVEPVCPYEMYGIHIQSTDHTAERVSGLAYAAVVLVVMAFVAAPIVTLGLVAGIAVARYGLRATRGRRRPRRETPPESPVRAD